MFQGKKDSDSLPAKLSWGEKGEEKKEKGEGAQIIEDDAVRPGHMVSISKKGHSAQV